MCVHIFIYGIICTTWEIIMAFWRPQIFCIQVRVSIPCGLGKCVKLPYGKKDFLVLKQITNQPSKNLLKSLTNITKLGIPVLMTPYFILQYTLPFCTRAAQTFPPKTMGFNMWLYRTCNAYLYICCLFQFASSLHSLLNVPMIALTVKLKKCQLSWSKFQNLRIMITYLIYTGYFSQSAHFKLTPHWREWSS